MAKTLEQLKGDYSSQKCYKEQPGYILNSLLIPFLDAAQELLVNGVADAETIDKRFKYNKFPYFVYVDSKSHTIL